VPPFKARQIADSQQSSTNELVTSRHQSRRHRDKHVSGKSSEISNIRKIVDKHQETTTEESNDGNIEVKHDDQPLSNATACSIM
jgi:hypothetical protein